MNNGAESIRIFHLIKSLGRGGAEMLLPEGLRFADRNRFDYRYGYFLPWNDALVPELQAQDVEVTCFGGSNNLQIFLSAARVARHLRRHSIDVLHCHLPIAGATGRVAGRIAGVPVVYSEHNKQERYHPLTRRLNRLTWRLQERAVAVSADVAESIHAHIGDAVPVDVVLNGVDIARFSRAGVDSAAVRAAHGIPAAAPVVGTVAVFREQKRLGDWVAAARGIHARHPTTHFLLVGDGPLRDEVAAAVNASGLQHVIHMPGLCKDVRPYLAAMDVYMMSSIFEGLPVALLEAMSMECVPVCTAVGGIPEVITSGSNGMLVEPERPDVLGRAVSDLLSAPGSLRALGTAAHQTVVQRFSMRRMAKELEATYLQVLERYRDEH